VEAGEEGFKATNLIRETDHGAVDASVTRLRP